VCVDNLLLHRTRVERGIDLAEVAARTSLNPTIVQSIDAGCFDALPAGLYARSYIRAFASAVGLQPEQVVRQLESSLPQVDDPLPVLREIARGAAPEWPDRIAQSTSDAARKLSALAARVGALAWPSTARRVIMPALEPLRVWRPSAVRCAAAWLDAAVLLLLLAIVVQLTAWASGAAWNEVLAIAGEQIAALWGVLVLVYFVILGGVGGRTPGAVLCGLPPNGGHEPLSLRTILERAILH
jgi:hypothetical protein